MRRFFGCLVLPLLLLAGCVAGFYAWWQSNTISFPEQNVYLHCPWGSTLEEGSGDYDFPESKTVSCREEEWGMSMVVSDSYGYNPATNELLYVVKFGGLMVKKVVYYAKPSDSLDLFKGLVMRCGGRQLKSGSDSFISYTATFQFDCAPEDTALFDCGVGTIAYLTDGSDNGDLHFRYKVRCGSESERIGQKKGDHWIDTTSLAKAETMAADDEFERLTTDWSEYGRAQAYVATLFLQEEREGRQERHDCVNSYASMKEVRLEQLLNELLESSTSPSEASALRLEQYLDAAQEESSAEYVACWERKTAWLH